MQIRETRQSAIPSSQDTDTTSSSKQEFSRHSAQNREKLPSPHRHGMNSKPFCADYKRPSAKHFRKHCTIAEQVEEIIQAEIMGAQLVADPTPQNNVTQTIGCK